MTRWLTRFLRGLGLWWRPLTRRLIGLVRSLALRRNLIVRLGRLLRVLHRRLYRLNWRWLDILAILGLLLWRILAVGLLPVVTLLLSWGLRSILILNRLSVLSWLGLRIGRVSLRVCIQRIRFCPWPCVIICATALNWWVLSLLPRRNIGGWRSIGPRYGYRACLRIWLVWGRW